MDENKYQILQIEGLRQKPGSETSLVRLRLKYWIKLKRSGKAIPQQQTCYACALFYNQILFLKRFSSKEHNIGHAIQKLATAPRAFDRTIKVLSSHSLIQYNPKQHLLSTDQLVQQVLKEAMDEATYRLWAERTVQAVAEVLPEMDESSGEHYKRYLSHAQGCAILIEQLDLTSSGAGQLLYQLADYLYDQACYEEAKPLYQRVLHILEQTLGPQHADVAYPLNNLASLYYEQGKYEEAEPLYQRVLHILEKTCGPEHPEVAYPLNNLANLYKEQGKNAQAKSLYQQVLQIEERTLGSNHPEVARLLNNLAEVCQKQGKYKQAEQLYQRVLHILEQKARPEHPEVTYPLNTLANLYKEQGKYVQAESLYQRVLHIREQLLGPEHPNMASLLHTLAHLSETRGSTLRPSYFTSKYCTSGKSPWLEPPSSGLYAQWPCHPLHPAG